MEEDKEKINIFGEEYQIFDDPNFNPSQGTGKNDTGANTHKNNSNFDKINELEEYQYPQTELKKNDKKTKEIFKVKHKNSIAGNSSKELSKILQRKTSRAEASTKKKKKTKSEMDFTLKNKTEVNCEDKKKEIEAKVYSMYNQEQYFDFYDTPPVTGDLFNVMNEDEASAEVNITKPIYNTTVNKEIPETFKMCISSEINQ